MLFVGERRVQHLLQRLDLARQAAVLAVDKHGDQGGIWLTGLCLCHHHPSSSTFIPAIPASGTTSMTCS